MKQLARATVFSFILGIALALLTGYGINILRGHFGPDERVLIAPLVDAKSWLWPMLYLSALEMSHGPATGIVGSIGGNGLLYAIVGTGAQFVAQRNRYIEYVVWMAWVGGLAITNYSLDTFSWSGLVIASLVCGCWAGGQRQLRKTSQAGSN